MYLDKLKYLDETFNSLFVSPRSRRQADEQGVGQARRAIGRAFHGGRSGDRRWIRNRGGADMSSTTNGFDMDLTRHSSIRQALSSSSTACVLNVAREPFEIVAVNSEWSKLCCYSPAEALYKNRKHVGDDVPGIHGPFSPHPADGPRLDFSFRQPRSSCRGSGPMRTRQRHSSAGLKAKERLA